jgi:hypothetical protein
MDIKLTLGTDTKLRSPTIQDEARRVQAEGPIYYPLQGRPRHCGPGDTVYFIRDGTVAARARVDAIVPKSELPRPLRTYSGRLGLPTAWSVSCSRMTVASRPVPHSGFQGFRYVSDDELPLFTAAFRRGGV